MAFNLVVSDLRPNKVVQYALFSTSIILFIIFTQIIYNISWISKHIYIKFLLKSLMFLFAMGILIYFYIQNSNDIVTSTTNDLLSQVNSIEISSPSYNSSIFDTQSSTIQSIYAIPLCMPSDNSLQTSIMGSINTVEQQLSSLSSTLVPLDTSAVSVDLTNLPTLSQNWNDLINLFQTLQVDISSLNWTNGNWIYLYNNCNSLFQSTLNQISISAAVSKMLSSSNNLSIYSIFKRAQSYYFTPSTNYLVVSITPDINFSFAQPSGNWYLTPTSTIQSLLSILNLNINSTNIITDGTYQYGKVFYINDNTGNILLTIMALSVNNSIYYFVWNSSQLLTMYTSEGTILVNNNNDIYYFNIVTNQAFQLNPISTSDYNSYYNLGGSTLQFVNIIPTNINILSSMNYNYSFSGGQIVLELQIQSNTGSFNANFSNGTVTAVANGQSIVLTIQSSNNSTGLSTYIL